MKVLVAALILVSPFAANAAHWSWNWQWDVCIRLNNFLSRQIERADMAAEDYSAVSQNCANKARFDACVDKYKRKYERAQQNVVDAQEQYVNTCAR
jgi:hypothetical protein